MENDNKFAQMRECILELIKNSDLRNNIKYKEIEMVYPGNVENTVQIEGRVSKQREMELNELREIIFDIVAEKLGNEEATNFMNESFQVTVGQLGEGEKFEPVEVFDLNGAKVTLKHEPGQVVLLDFWATWCGYCQEPMQENVDLMTKDTKLKDKNVHIIGISTDENTNQWKNHVNQKKWEVIPQYVKPNIIKAYGIKGIPCIAILDKEGKVNYLGHPKSINLEQKLLELAEGKFTTEESPNVNSFWLDLDNNSKSDIVAEANFVIKDSGVKDCNFCVSTTFKLNEKNEFKPVKTTPVFYGQVTPYEYELLETNVAINLQTNFNFNDFNFKVKVIQMGVTEDF